MIQIRIEREGGKIRRVFGDGHSLYGPKGKDIVCAGVSAILQTALLGLEAHLPKSRLFARREDGMLDIKIGRLNMEEEAKASAILETMLLGLKCIEGEHPGYIKIIDGEGGGLYEVP